MYRCKTGYSNYHHSRCMGARLATPLITNEKLRKEDGSSEVDGLVYKSLFATPSQTHYGAAKRILRYLQGTINYGIWYKSTTGPRIFGYTYNDWAGLVDDMKNTSGYESPILFMF
ncbi:unnamed protein product [Prunus armeniaca]